MLRVASPGCLERDRNEDRSSLGAEAAYRFLRQIGVAYDSNAMVRTRGGSACAPQGERAYSAHRKRTQELDATRELDHSRERVSLLRPRQHFPQERSMYIPLSRRQGGGGCAHKHNLNGAGIASCAEPCSAGREQSPAAGAQTLLDARTASNTKGMTAGLLWGDSSPSDSPMLPSKSKWVVHGVGDSSYHHEGANSASEGSTDANEVDVDIDEGRRKSR